MPGDDQIPRFVDDILDAGEFGLPEAEWNALLKVAPELTLKLAAAGAGIRAARWDALERLLALLPSGGGTVDERFSSMAPPTVSPGEVTDSEREWLLAALYGIRVGWHFTAPGGID